MRISVLADSGPQVGLGHAARCLGLAEGFNAEAGVKAHFYLSDLQTRHWIVGHRYPVGRRHPAWSDYMIVDSYQQTQKTFGRLRKRCRTLIVIDDFGHPYVKADWILNSAPMASRLPYACGSSGHLMLGPRYHPLRREYWANPKRRGVRKRVNEVLIMLGGGGIHPQMRRILPIVRMALPEAFCQVVVGSGDRYALKSGPQMKVTVSPRNVRPFLEQCDLAITGAGQTLYELAFTGLPAVAVQMASNQAHNIKVFQECGTILSAGRPDQAGFDRRLLSLIKRLASNTALRQKMSRAGQTLVDGLGARRAARTILAGALAT